MNAARDHYLLFGLPRRFALDTAELEQRYRALQAEVHPDRHAHRGEAEQLSAMQLATQVNEAYRTLRQPLARGRYLLHLQGRELAVENNNAMPASFLIEQLELRESVEAARAEGALDRLDTLRFELRRCMDQQLVVLQTALDQQNDLAQAEEILLRLMFQDKLLREIDDAVEAIEA